MQRLEVSGAVRLTCKSLGDKGLKELIIYVSCCFISINNRLLVVKCYSSLVVSGFSRNEFNSYILFNFCCCFYLFLFDVKIKGD